MPKSKGVYKRGKTWWIRYAGPDGLMRFESAGRGTSHRDAQTMLLQRKQEVLEGRDPTAAKRIKKHTFGELAEIYLAWAERQRSHRIKKGHIGLMVEYFGDCQLNSFTTYALERYQNELLKQNKAHATVNRRLATLKHMFTKAADWEMVGENSLKRIRKVKMLKESNRRLRYLTEEEGCSLINNCARNLKPIVITALNTGMRKEEILSLKWDNVDMRNGFILLEDTKNGERREVPINKTLQTTLSKIIRHINSPYVFKNANGKRFMDIRGAFNKALKLSGIKDFKFHDLRHTFASRLVMGGIDIVTVKEILGHKTLAMTMRYAHLAPNHKKESVKILDEYPGNEGTIQNLYKQEK